MNSYGQLGIGNNIIMTSNVNTFTPVVCNSLFVDSFSGNSFKIYPNPSSNFLVVENNSNTDIENISIKDLTGKMVLKFAKNVSVLNIESLENGMYLINITSDKKNYSYKFIKN